MGHPANTSICALACALIASCATTDSKRPENSRHASVQTNVEAAYQDLVQRVEQRSGGSPAEMRVAFVARAKPVPYVGQKKSLTLDNPLGYFGAGERQEGLLDTKNYVDAIRSFAEEENAAAVGFQVYDRDALSAVMKSVSITDASELFVQKNAITLREASVQTEPIDGLVLLELTGVQDSEDSPLIHWTLECKLVDLRPGAMPPMVSYKRWSEEIDTKSVQFGVTSTAPAASSSSPSAQSSPVPSLPRISSGGSDSEPNNSLAESKLIEVRGSVSGMIGVNDTEDWYTIVPPTEGYLSVRMTNTKPKDTNGQAPIGTLQTAAGQQLGRFGGMYHADQANQTQKELVMAGSTYYIHLTAADKERNVPYRLDVMFEQK